MRSIRLHLTIPGQAATAVYTTLADVLRPVEVDTTDLGARQIHVRQSENEGAPFEGAWSCVPDGNDTAVTFAAWMDMGTPWRVSTLEPLAARTLVDDTVALMTRVFGDVTRIDDIVMQARRTTAV